MKTTCLWVTCVLGLIGGPISSAFAATATLTGRVTDSTGAVLPGATVTAANVETNTTVSSVSNRDGVYALSNLATGTYRVTVELSGFQTMVKPDVQAHVGDTITLDFELPVGSVLESVTVQGGAPLVKTTAEVSTLVDRQFVENLPLNGRSIQSLLSLTPGVVLTKVAEDTAGQFSINGQRTDANYFTVDGVSANAGVQAGLSFPGEAGSGSLPALSALGTTQNLVAVDALQEFRVQTSTFAPEFGRMAGGQISMVTRSGTNAFHGSAFEYFRHDALDANDWFGNSRGIPKPEERQHDFGGIFGGPLWRNRAFFFASSEALRLRQPVVKLLAVPSLAVRQGAVAAARPYLDAFPLPTGRELPNGQAEFLAAYTDPARLDANSVRVDYTRSGVTLFGRFNHAPSSREVRSLSQVARAQLNTKTLTIGLTWLVRPDTTNDVRVNLSANDSVARAELDSFMGAVRPSDAFLYPVALPGDRSDMLFAFAGTDSSYSVGNQSLSEQHQLNVVETFSRLAGAHQLKIGVDYRLLTPVFTSRPLTSLVFQNVAQVSTGMLTRLNVGVGAEPRHPEFLNVSAYGQDSWQMAPRLTATYGVRWDYTPPPSVRDGRGPAALKDASDPRRIELAPSGTPLWRASRLNFAPRIGVAYRAAQSPHQETVIRGGAGLFYDLGMGQVATSFGDTYPYYRQVLTPDVRLPLTGANLIAPVLNDDPPYTQTWTFDPAFRTPYTVQWNIAIERSMGSHQTASASVVGAAGHRLLKKDYILGATQGGIGPADFLLVSLARNAASSTYRALQLQFRRRLGNGVQALGSYTWSRSVDNVSSEKTRVSPLAFYDPEVDRGYSDFDVRHAFSGALTYSLPQPSGRLRTVLGGWGVDMNAIARSGFPIDVFSTRNLGFGNLPYRPDAVPGVNAWIEDPLAAGGRRLNPAAFSIPAGRQGTSARNGLRGFGMWQIDASLRRQLTLSSGVALQLRADLFNILNHPNFSDPDPSLTSSTFGQSTQMLSKGLGGLNALHQSGGSRSTQLAIKVLF